MRRLFRIADIKLDIIGALKRQKIFLRCRSTLLFWSSNCRCHKLPPRFLALSAFFKYKIDNPPSQGRGTPWFTLLPFPSTRVRRRFFRSADRRSRDPKTEADAIGRRLRNNWELRRSRELIARQVFLAGPGADHREELN